MYFYLIETTIKQNKGIRSSIPNVYVHNVKMRYANWSRRYQLPMREFIYFTHYFMDFPSYLSHCIHTMRLLFRKDLFFLDFMFILILIFILKNVLF